MQRENVLQLRDVMQQFIRSFGLLEQTKTPCGFSLSLSQVFALQELEKQTLTITELAEKLQLERSSVSRLIDVLVKGDFVSRELNENNRREVILALTEKGIRSIQRLRDQSVEFYNSILSKMSESEQFQFSESFKAFTQSLLEVRKDSALRVYSHGEREQ
ncbi:MarR family transcriptional regulator [Paenibacillus sp. sptzw28]|uniref:MarR family winged helix-turn-helix transcriptional regulator n=1 Tax=Paenibacillus sp. sptzw28 TaxID=715179 RepID=UPI001C6EE1A6|nr:MarR family transcriptional regulator [Paenibacillus sp. sptzw28]QYR22267.1 MarR family transcriptional regulator [Paenibacillus sp. sptzw28]